LSASISLLQTNKYTLCHLEVNGFVENNEHQYTIKPSAAWENPAVRRRIYLWHASMNEKAVDALVKAVGQKAAKQVILVEINCTNINVTNIDVTKMAAGYFQEVHVQSN
jgi:hypothetical protein